MRPGPQRPLESTWEDWTLGGGLPACFARPGLPLEVEIGPGDDDFLLDSALARPEHNWLGVEYSRKRVNRYLRRVRERAGEPGNLRLVWRPAQDLVGPFLSPARVVAYHVHFPDPWPKKHHRRYRTLGPAFVADLARSLVPGGEVRVLTDDLDYALEVLQAFDEVGGWLNRIPPPGHRRLEPGEVGTVFEERWRAAGRAIHRLHLARGA